MFIQADGPDRSPQHVTGPQLSNILQQINNQVPSKDSTPGEFN